MDADERDRATEAGATAIPRGAVPPLVGFLRGDLADLADGTALDQFANAHVLRLVTQFEQHRELAFRFGESGAHTFQIVERRHERLLGDDVDAAFEERQQLLGAQAVFIGDAAHIHQRVLDEMPPLLVTLCVLEQWITLEKRSQPLRIVVGDRDHFDIAELLCSGDHCPHMALESDEREFHGHLISSHEFAMRHSNRQALASRRQCFASTLQERRITVAAPFQVEDAGGEQLWPNIGTRVREVFHG